MSTGGGTERVRGSSRDALSDAKELLKASNCLASALEGIDRNPIRSMDLVKEAKAIFRQLSDSRGGDETLDSLARSASQTAVIINMYSLSRTPSPDAADGALRKLILDTARQTRSSVEVAAAERITEALSADTLIDEENSVVRDGTGLPRSA